MKRKQKEEEEEEEREKEKKKRRRWLALVLWTTGVCNKKVLRFQAFKVNKREWGGGW